MARQPLPPPSLTRRGRGSHRHRRARSRDEQREQRPRHLAQGFHQRSPVRGQVARHLRKLGTGLPNLKLLTLTGGVLVATPTAASGAEGSVSAGKAVARSCQAASAEGAAARQLHSSSGWGERRCQAATMRSGLKRSGITAVAQAETGASTPCRKP